MTPTPIEARILQTFGEVVMSGRTVAEEAPVIAAQSAANRPHYVTTALRSLTRTERRHVLRGCIGGDFQMRTLRNLRRKGLFYLKIDSPNGQWGVMELTPLGVTVRGILRERSAATPQNTGQAQRYEPNDR